MSMHLVASALLILLSSSAYANLQQFAYAVTGKDAAQLYEGLAREPRAFTDADGHRKVIYVHYEYPGSANVRIRTEITCSPPPSECQVAGYHLTFVPGRPR